MSESDGRLDAVEPRPCIEIRPSETTLSPGAVVGAMEELQAFLADSTNRGLRHTLFRSAHIPRVEWMLASDDAIPSAAVVRLPRWSPEGRP